LFGNNILNRLFLFHLGLTEAEDIPGLGQYDDFQTIDWQRDLARDRMRHRYIIKHKQDSIWDFIKAAHDAWSGWLCVFLVGLAAGKSVNTILFYLDPPVQYFQFLGTVASVVDIGTTWMTDLKYGICPDAFWLDREQCCWSNQAENCTQVLIFAKSGENKHQQVFFVTCSGYRGLT
jgi:chloride channel 3/4/5